MKPKSIGSEEMIERAAKTLKENANWTPVILVGKGESGSVKAGIGPSVIGGELLKNGYGHIGLCGRP